MSDLSPQKAKKILKDGTVHGKPLTEKQRRFMGARAGGSPLRKSLVSRRMKNGS